MISKTSCKVLSLFVIFAFFSSQVSAQLNEASASFTSPLRRGRRLAEESTETTAEQPAEKLAEQPAEKLAEQPAEKLAEQPAEKLAEQPAEKLAEEPVEELAGATTPKSINNFPKSITDILPKPNTTNPKVTPTTTTKPKVTPTTTINPASKSNNSSEQVDLPMAKMIMDLLDDYRVSLGLSKLTWGDNMYKPTLDHTQYQVDQGMISHDNFNVRAKNCSTSAENVAMFGGETVADKDGANKFMKMWKESPGHDANMRNGSVSQVSIAVIYCKVQQAYYSTMFLFKP